MAIFGRKKTGSESPASGETSETPAGTPGTKFEVHADKARKFFEHARAVHDTTNFEYAMQLWLSGLRQDPTSMAGMEGFFESAAKFLGSGAKGPSKETLRMFSERDDVARFLMALLEWGMKPLDQFLSVRAAEAAARLELAEQSYWIGERAMNVVARDRRPRKDLFLKLMKVFGQVGAFEKAVQAGEAAVRMDPSDGPLAAEVRNLSAQAAMSRGGFDQTGKAGGFRANIRDADRQRQLVEQEQIVKSDEAVDRLLKTAEDDFRARPDDRHSAMAYLKRLRERGRPEDEKRAYQVASQMYEKSSEFRFRQIAGEIKLRQAERKVAEYVDLAKANPDNAVAQENARRARVKFLEMEIEEIGERAKAYPTDLHVKFDLAKRYFELERFDEAIPLLQEAKDDAKARVEALHLLGQAFLRTSYVDEAIYTLRQAREVHKVETDDTGLNLSYGLLLALQTKAESERDLPAAEEADKLASTIMIQQFNFKDVRARRDAIKKLITELKRGDAA